MPRSNDGGVRAVASMEVGPFVGAINKAIGSMAAFAKKAGFLGTALAAVGVILGYQLAKQLIKSGQEIKRYQMVVVELAKVLQGGIPEAQVIARNIGEMSKVMPTARAELFNVAEIAARLGIRGVANIKEFTRVASMMGVATNLSADIAADAFARILKQTQTPVSAFEQLGSVVNELANNMATTTAEIVDAMRRSAPDMARLGFDAGQIAAVAASINEVSESATRAGTRLRRFAQNIASPAKLQIFAEAIDMNANALRDMFKEKPVEALLKIVKAFRDGGKAADMLAGSLDSRVRQVLAQLAQNYGGLNQAIGIYNEQMRLQNSLAKEYGLFADTIVSKQQLIKNAMEDTQREIGEAMAPLLLMWAEVRLEWAKFVNYLVVDPLDLSAPKDEVDAFREAWHELKNEVNETIDVIGKTQEHPGFENKLVKGTTGVYLWSSLREQTPWEEKVEVMEAMSGAVTYLERDLQNLGTTNMMASEVLFKYLLRLGESAQAAAGASEDYTGLSEAFDSGTSEAHSYISALNLMEAALGDADGFANGLAENTLSDLRIKWQENTISMEEMIVVIQSLTHFATNFGTAAARAGSDMGIYTDAATALIGQLKGQQLEAMYGRLGSILEGPVFNAANEDDQGAIRTLVEWLQWWERKQELEEEEEARLKALQDAQEKYDESFKNLTQSMKDRIATGAAITDEEKRSVEKYIELRDSIEGLTLMDSLYTMSLLAQAWALEDAAAAREKLTDATTKAEKEWEKIEKRLADMNLETLASQFRLMERVIEGMADSMVEAFEAIVSGSGNAGQAVIQMIRDIAAELLKAQIMKFLFELARKWNLGPFSGSGGQGFDVGDLSETVRLAKGGPLRAGRMALVGEQGPEMFVPSVSGTVVPNNQLGGGQELHITNHYTIQALDSASVRQMLTKEQDTIAGLAIDKINRHRSLKRI